MLSRYSCAISNPAHGFQSPGISMDTLRSSWSYYYSHNKSYNQL